MQEFGHNMIILLLHNTIDHDIHTTFAFDMVSPYTLLTFGIRFDPKHPLFECQFFKHLNVFFYIIISVIDNNNLHLIDNLAIN